MKIIEKGLTQQPWTHETHCYNCGAHIIIEKQDLFLDENAKPECRDHFLLWTCVECGYVGRLNASHYSIALNYARRNKKTIKQLLEQILERLNEP